MRETKINADASAIERATAALGWGEEARDKALDQWVEHGLAAAWKYIAAYKAAGREPSYSPAERLSRAAAPQLYSAAPAATARTKSREAEMIADGAVLADDGRPLFRALRDKHGNPLP